MSREERRMEREREHEREHADDADAFERYRRTERRDQNDDTMPGRTPVVTATRVGRDPYPRTAQRTHVPGGGLDRPGVFTRRRPGYLPRRDGRRDNDGAGWLLGLLILVLLGVLLWWFLTQGDDSTIDEPSSGGLPTQTGATGATGGEAGQITTTDGRDLLASLHDASGDDTAGSSSFEHDTVQSDGVEVLTVVGDEAFWVGTSNARVLVALTPNGESVIDVDVGDVVAFSGIVRPVPNDAEGSFGIDEGEGMGELQDQGLYIEALTARVVAPSG
jgi:hypothetical protein